jgi:hypothetical protein
MGILTCLSHSLLRLLNHRRFPSDEPHHQHDQASPCSQLRNLQKLLRSLEHRTSPVGLVPFYDRTLSPSRAYPGLPWNHHREQSLIIIALRLSSRPSSAIFSLSAPIPLDRLIRICARRTSHSRPSSRSHRLSLDRDKCPRKTFEPSRATFRSKILCQRMRRSRLSRRSLVGSDQT